MSLFDDMREEFKKQKESQGNSNHRQISKNDAGNDHRSKLLKNHANPTPNGLDGPGDHKNTSNDNGYTITPHAFSNFEPVQGYAKKLGPIPMAMDDVERTKLRLGLKIGLFYYQYTILLKNLKTFRLMAPRGHRENNPA